MEDWIEVPTTELIVRLERLQTVDLAAFEVAHMSSLHPAGEIDSFTWIMLGDDGQETPAFLATRYPGRDRLVWHVHADLLAASDQL